MKKQVVVIHGGTAFDSYKEFLRYLRAYKIDLDRFRYKDWKISLSKKLGRGFEVIAPQMPNRMNARYLEWATWFKKYLRYIRNGVILIGHSMGGIFLAKLLSETKLPKKIRAVLLVSAPYDRTPRESLGTFKLPKSLRRITNQVGKIFLYYSKDDKVVPFADLSKYQRALPNAHVRIFKNRGHFNQAKFPELVRDIKGLYK